MQIECFLKFQPTHLNLIIRQRSFESLKPFFVKHVKDQNICCCIYHVELNELRLALNLVRTNNTIHDTKRCGCHCDNVCSHHGQPCQASCVVYKWITHLWEDVVCPKGGLEEWQKRKCLFGNCPMCGVQILSFCPKELVGSLFDIIQWCRFALETTMSRNGQSLKNLTLVYKTTTLDEFIDYLKPKLQHFVKHNFVAWWEDKQFKQSITSFPTNIVVSIVHFVENYTFEVQNEVKYALA